MYINTSNTSINAHFFKCLICHIISEIREACKSLIIEFMFDNETSDSFVAHGY